MPPLHLFQGFGIEIEHMLVDRDSLDVAPVCDRVLEAVAGEPTEEVELGDTAWSNELALHVLEFKTNGPAPDLGPLPERFAADVRRADELASRFGARLLPTGMHPWMDPHAELKLWPGAASPIYETFHRIFDCRGHGWANLQSVHLNLPFSGDEEFGRLHAAIRLVLPLLPALAASTPVADGAPTGLVDTRLDQYRRNCARVPSVAGHVVPERVWTKREYQQGLLASVHKDMQPHDPEGVLRHEWINARGAIARFDRDAIEIRLLDTQECPRADLGLCTLVVAVVRALVDERWEDWAEQRTWSERRLAAILGDTIRDGEEAVVDDVAYLEMFGLPLAEVTADELWAHLADETLRGDDAATRNARDVVDHVLDNGTLARRILRAVGDTPDRDRLREVYGRLADCLLAGELFT